MEFLLLQAKIIQRYVDKPVYCTMYLFAVSHLYKVPRLARL